MSGELQRLKPMERQNILDLHREMEGTIGKKGGHQRTMTETSVERI